ncbi:LysM peptidoglycan-binding domain-containing protein [Arenibacter sp. N53]|uniref:glucosaminidase domain-containing protein n=1 Tax=Arenibacter TaxID=178469 RepID=UPI000CD4787F|nr:MULTISPECIES: glucosaminidase domain-containing protein [Arenibacter]MCM4150945.1 LysM peptidoglycan-binding domain-containing protein [Arenibacter sp. N53]
MIKRIAITMFLGVFLVSCGVKKKTTYAKKPNVRTTTASTKAPTKPLGESKNEGDYALPEDNGNFVKFTVNTTEEYIETFAEIAQFEMKAYGIPASITLAQGILESGAGRGVLGAKTNNHFGIKCHSDWDGDYDFHDDDAKGECFRKYNHPMYSFRDHSVFLSSRARYAFLFDLEHDDYKGWAYGLREAGYATDRKYPHKLIALIERYELDKYDRKVVGSGTIVKREPKQYDYKIHVVQRGDTLYSISKRYFVSIPELMKLNNMTNSNLAEGQKLTVKSEKIR